MDKEMWGKWGKALGEVMREEKNRVVDEVCDKYGTSDEKRRGLKRVAPITVAWPDGVIQKFGK